ncbi:unnamed protein product [Macrosiphum euphorbiae]|uniref:Uncharacterized protein n=1 Tax=Macrosiphum euphorbiae TaxID=13131 RepID=A0AAV0WPK2_9HEMI|nr:unnamed protein product [Macrosiphum euphorbiae]
MEVIDLEFTSTADAVLAAVKKAILEASKGDAKVAAACGDISVTSMWRLTNFQQVAKVRVPRSVKPTEVSHVRVGWTNCRFKIRRPEAIRCSGPDMSDSYRKCGDKSHKEKECPSDKCVACDRAGLKLGPHRPGSAACGAKRTAGLCRSNNRRND